MDNNESTIPLQAIGRRISGQNMLRNSVVAWNTTMAPNGLESALKSIEENAYIVGLYGCVKWGFS